MEVSVSNKVGSECTLVSFFHVMPSICAHIIRGISWFFSLSGEDVLRRYLSNERIPTISEESHCYPVPYRPPGERLVRGVDHIRGSQCFINADLHNSATIPYQEAVARKNSTAKTSKRPPSEPSLFSSWLAKLKLFTHWLWQWIRTAKNYILANENILTY